MTALVTDSAMRTVLTDVGTIAIVGLSDKPDRASNQVCAFLVERGYGCVGVNPALAGQTVHGAPVFASLAAVDRPIGTVDIFRASEAAEAVVDEALALVPRPRLIWMQSGVVSEVAACIARAAGLTVVMDRCLKIEMARLSTRV